MTRRIARRRPRPLRRELQSVKPLPENVHRLPQLRHDVGVFVKIIRHVRAVALRPRQDLELAHAVERVVRGVVENPQAVAAELEVLPGGDRVEVQLAERRAVGDVLVILVVARVPCVGDEFARRVVSRVLRRDHREDADLLRPEKDAEPQCLRLAVGRNPVRRVGDGDGDVLSGGDLAAELQPLLRVFGGYRQICHGTDLTGRSLCL